MSDQPYLGMICKACSHEWVQTFNRPVKWSQVAKVRCPKCRATFDKLDLLSRAEDER